MSRPEAPRAHNIFHARGTDIQAYPRQKTTHPHSVLQQHPFLNHQVNCRFYRMCFLLTKSTRMSLGEIQTKLLDQAHRGINVQCVEPLRIFRIKGREVSCSCSRTGCVRERLRPGGAHRSAFGIREVVIPEHTTRQRRKPLKSIAACAHSPRRLPCWRTLAPPRLPGRVRFPNELRHPPPPEWRGRCSQLPR